MRDLLSDVQVKHVTTVLKAAIKAKGLTAVEVAEKSGYTDKVVRELLGYGKGKPRETVTDICSAVGIDLDAVLRDSHLDASSSELDGSIYRLLQAKKIRTQLTILSDEYDKAEHPFIPQLVDRIVQKFCSSDLFFTKQMSPAMTHQDFAYLVSPYIRETVDRIRGLSRSTVTDWRKLNPAGQLYFDAQRKKDVTRIFVLASEAEFNAFNKAILPAHEKLCGANKLFICSETTAVQLIDGRITSGEDFAIFDDDLVAFCSGSKVRMRIDNLVNAIEIFNSFMLHFGNNPGHSYEELRNDVSKVHELFIER